MDLAMGDGVFPHGHHGCGGLLDGSFRYMLGSKEETSRSADGTFGW